MRPSIDFKGRRLVLVHPHVPIPGALSVVAWEDKTEEIKLYENDRKLRRWKTRAVIYDHLPNFTVRQGSNTLTPPAKLDS